MSKVINFGLMLLVYVCVAAYLFSMLYSMLIGESL